MGINPSLVLYSLYISSSIMLLHWYGILIKRSFKLANQYNERILKPSVFFHNCDAAHYAFSPSFPLDSKSNWGDWFLSNWFLGLAVYLSRSEISRMQTPVMNGRLD